MCIRDRLCADIVPRMDVPTLMGVTEPLVAGGCAWPAGATPAVEGGVACDPAAPPAEEDAFWPIRSSGLREAALRPSARCRST
eukprot:204122-Alexandrium_andersonii.AAC.1